VYVDNGVNILVTGSVTTRTHPPAAFERKLFIDKATAGTGLAWEKAVYRY
jgi:hypothetical protein